MINPKYSILLPVHNGSKYIKECLDSIIATDYKNFELVISENFSDDGTKEIIEEYAYKYDFIKVFHTNELLNQPDNWSNAITHAKGEWLMLLGVDDALVPNCFKIADILTHYADEKKLNIIKSNRIYYFWNDEVTKKLYNNLHYSYLYRKKIEVKNTRDVLYNAVYEESFTDMPQMYTSSMFRNILVDKIKSLSKDEKIIKYISPDAYLGAAACYFEEKYVYAYMPFAWVGTSSSSQGFRDSKEYEKTLISVSKEEYKNFDAKTYKTINSTALLVTGAMKIIQEKLEKKIKYEIDELQVVKNVVYRKQIAKDEYFCNLKDLMTAFCITNEDIFYYKYKKDVFTNITDFTNRIINKLFPKKTFSALYDDEKTKNWKYTEINKLIN